MIKIQPYRGIVAWGVALGYIFLPFVEVGGESVFRFDVPTLRLHFFGTAIWMQEFYYVLLAGLLATALFLFVTLVWGRVWCGWLCPQTVLNDIAATHKGGVRSYFKFLLKQAQLAVMSVSSGVVTVGYFVSPYELYSQALGGELGPVSTGSVIVISLLTYLNLVFIGRKFCSTICPYAKLQGAMTDEFSLEIGMDSTRQS